jgi:tetratricopeptide (TPR) repeat protein
MTRNHGPFRFILLPTFLLPLVYGCGPGYTPEELAEATAQVRQAYYDKDHQFGTELGERWTSKAPDALELRAWTAANWALATLSGERFAREVAEEMMAVDPDSPWTSFALVRALLRAYPPAEEEKAFEASGRVLATLPDSPDAFILRAGVLVRYLDRDTALAFLNGAPDPIKADLDVREFMASRLAPPGRERTDSDVQNLLDLYEGILAEDPNHISANYGLARLLMTLEIEDEKAHALLDHAASLSPSPGIHWTVWSEILDDPSLTAEDRASKVTADVRHVLDNFPESPGRWGDMATGLDWFGYPALQTELEERVLTDYSESWAAEKVLAARISQMAYELSNERPADDEAARAESDRLEEMVADFVARPQHRDLELLQDAYWQLFLLEKKKPDPDLGRLSHLAETWAGYLPEIRDIWADQKCLLGALSLAQHPQTLEAGKSLLAAGKVEMDKFLAERERQDQRFSETVFDAQEAHIRSSNAYLSIASALVLAQEGSFEEAEALLSQVRDYDPEDDDSWTVLPLADLAAGKVKEWRADLARENGDEATAQKFLTSAEDFYLHGLRGDYYPRPSYGVGWTNPVEGALKDLFEKRHGGLDGFEAYLASAVEGGLDARRAEILATRIQAPQPILPFALKNLDGEEVTSESYLGKVVVINFWGTW